MLLSRTFYSLDFLWPQNRWQRRNFLLESGDGEAIFPFTPPSRGLYRLLPALQIQDIMGFFTFQIPLPSYGPKPVTDNPSGEQEIREPRISLSRIQTQKKDTDEELFEIRPYYPGDDPRKLNWKLMAHSGDLFIRQGEDGTPFLSKIYCILNTEIQGVPREIQLLWNDILIREFHSLLLQLQQKPLEIMIALPGMEEFRALGQSGPIEEKLAAAGSMEMTLKTRQIKDGPLLILSYAWSDSLNAWLKNSQARDITLMIKKPPFPENSSKGKLEQAWDMVFMKEEQREPGELSVRKLKQLKKEYHSVMENIARPGECHVLDI